jgi:protein HIRA/HIR1
LQISSTHRNSLTISIANRSDNIYEAQSKISFIEHQIKLCITVNSPVELKHWYSMLGFQLATHASEKKVRQVLDDLLGPIYSLQDPEIRAKHKILSIDKHELLREVLTNLRSTTNWQRIYMEYQDQLNEMEATKKKNGTNGGGGEAMEAF